MSNTQESSNLTIESDCEATPSLGDQLFNAREDAGLSIDDVANKLYISKVVVNELETDTVPESSNALFYRGYVKSYAVLVGLDCDDMVKTFRAQYHCDDDLKTMQTFSNRSKNDTHNSYLNWVTRGVVVVILIAVVVWWQQRQSMSEIPTVAQEPIAIAKEPSPRLPIAPIVNAALEVDTNNLQSTFTFSQDCWVKITDATNAVVAIGIKKAGTSIEISGVPPLEVILGAPQGVEIIYQQQILDISSYISNETAKFTLPLEQ